MQWMLLAVMLLLLVLAGVVQRLLSLCLLSEQRQYDSKFIWDF